MGVIYQQGKRSEDEVGSFEQLRVYLAVGYGPGRHLERAQLERPRHKLPFPSTLHLDICPRCAASNRRRGGPWVNCGPVGEGKGALTR